MGTIGQNELADNCENKPDGYTTVAGFLLSRYWSNFDNNCEPRLDPPAGSTSAVWVLGQASPLQRFTGSVHSLDLGVPAARLTTNAQVTEVMLAIQTGSDDLRGGSGPGDNANATLHFAGGSTTTVNLNSGRSWENGQTHVVRLMLPATPIRVSDITGVTISTQFSGGLSGDNWNIDKVALVVSFPTSSVTSGPPPVIVHEWLDASGGPLVRFTGDIHDHSEGVLPQDVGQEVFALNLIISTGNDDLRGGSSSGDNCDVTVELASGQTITLNNVNGGHGWGNWTNATIPIPLPAGGMKGGNVKSVKLHTGFGGGIGGDNWNVNRLQLQATLTPVITGASWFLVNNQVKMQPGAPVTALWRSNGTHLDLFATGSDGAVWSNWWEAAHGWQPWFLVNNQVKMQPGAAVTALWRSNDTHLDLFATGTDGAVWSTWWEAARGWQPWFLVHNETKMRRGAAVTALWRSNDSHLDLFATGTDGAVWSTWWEAAHGWQPWFLVHNETKMEPGTAVTALWRSNDTHLDLFATGTDGAVWSTWWEAAHGWQAWFLVNNQVKMQAGATVTALWRSNDSHLDLFSTGTDGAVWSNWWEAAHGWSSWFLVHNEVKMQRGAAVTAVWRSNDTHLDLFSSGNDGAVWSIWWDAASGW